MEFQYCDSCGDITQTNHAKGNELLCASCAGKGGPAQDPGPPPSGLQLLEDPTQELSDGTPIGGSDLDFFSNDTLAMRRPPSKPKSTSKLKLVDESPSAGAPPLTPPAPNPAGETLGMTQPMGGTIYPKKDDERWRVDCLHCAGSLSVRPAVKRSKLRCPRCKGVMVLEPSGEVTSVGSTVVQRRAPEPKAPPKPAPFQTPSKPAAAAPPAPTPSPSPVAPPIAPPPPALAAMGTSSTGDDSLGRFEQSFLGNTGGATAVAPPPTQVQAPAMAPVPMSPPPMAPTAVATAPVAGGGQEFAISPDNTVGYGDSAAPGMQNEGAYAGSGVSSMTRHSTEAGSEVTTMGNLQAFTWMTVALLPSIVGLLVVHQASGVVGQTFLEGMGTQVTENAGKVLDWCAKVLGR